MVVVAELLALVVVAFAGGALGAAIGALEAFSLAGVLVVVGEAAALLRPGAPGPAGEMTALGSTGLTATLGLGPFFGPHVAFAGGAAAAAFAARQGYMDTDFEYHEAKNVTYALGPRLDVMAVGGVFGAVGVGLAAGSVRLGLPWDPIAFSIVASGLLHRVALGYPVVGRVAGENVLDMSPFERRQRRSPRADGGVADRSGIDPEGAAGSGRRLATEPWLPHQYAWEEVAVLGAVVGAFGGFVTHQTGSPFLAFGVAAASLLFLCVGVERFPVTHHAALVSSLAVVGLTGAAAGDVSLAVAVAIGAVFGVLTAVVGEVAQRLLYAHADTHLDPPAVAIVVGTLLVALLDTVGVFEQGLLPVL
ncbi:hypothetical protein BRD14_00990 [Halobacteriales archaeon SW_5_68_122]|nr:MAG: hypothetical protein BRD14_00990 [Halobacteriales archaeon SW_5_68_122]